jgi:hypothetical protein
MRCVAALAVACAALASMTPAPAQERTNRDQSEYSELYEEGFPTKAVDAVLAATEAPLRDGDLVLGVVVNGRARAYDINSLWLAQHEVLNDELGGEAIAATWCPIAHTGAVYSRLRGDEELELGAIGLDRGALVMYDSQTRSWWSQVTGEAVRGELAGEQLQQLPSNIATWSQWRERHPDTDVYVDPAVRNRLRFTDESWGLMTMGGSGAVRNEDLVIGVEGARTARAYLARRLAGSGVKNDVLDGSPIVVFLSSDGVTASVLSRQLGESTLTMSAQGDALRDTQTGSVWDPLTGKAESGPMAGEQLKRRTATYALWYAWQRYRPDSELWEGE